MSAVHFSMTNNPVAKPLTQVMATFPLGVSDQWSDSEAIPLNGVQFTSLEFAASSIVGATGFEWYLCRDAAGRFGITQPVITGWRKTTANAATATATLDLPYRAVENLNPTGSVYIAMAARTGTASVSALLFWLHTP